MYSHSPKVIPLLLNSIKRYFSVRDETGQLIGYCCFGDEAKVAGGEYSEGEPEIVDVGIGMNPGLVGRGFGRAFVAAILGFATNQYHPERFRVSIAEFNKRSQKTFQNLGFVETHRFPRDGDGMEFVQLERDVEGRRISKSIR